MRNHFWALRGLAILLAVGLAPLGPPAFAQRSGPLDPALVGIQTAKIDLKPYQNLRYVVLGLGNELAGAGTREDPWNTLEFALDQIRDAGPANRYALLVAEGVYPCRELRLKPYVDLYGGFIPPRWETRNAKAHVTILDGGRVARILVGADHARLDGFTLTNGASTGPGGAILCDGTSPEIVNCYFTGNKTVVSTEPTTASLALRSVPGGAIACLGDAAPNIDHNIFTFNATMDGAGGAVACLDDARPVIGGNVFSGNATGTAEQPPVGTSAGGAIACLDRAAPSISNNMFTNNLAGGHSLGGAIHGDPLTAPLLANNVITGNICEGSGGGISLSRPRHALISANVIMQNTARELGGGIFIGAGGEARVENTILAGNKAGRGGAIALDSGRLELVNDTLCDNAAEGGGGVYLANRHDQATSIRIVNGILTGNVPPDPFFFASQDVRIAVTYSNVEGNAPGRGNIDRPPRFVNDALSGGVGKMLFDRNTYQTSLTLNLDQRIGDNALRGRVIRVGTKRSIIDRNRRIVSDTEGGPQRNQQAIYVWGDLTGAGANVPPTDFDILPTYHLAPRSPAIDRGSHEGAAPVDLEGNRRPINGGYADRADMGAIEFRIPREAPRIRLEGDRIRITPKLD